MIEWQQWQSPVYWSAFVAAFLGVAVWESYSPSRTLKSSAGKRWAQHGMLYLLAGLLAELFPLGGQVLLAVAAETRSWGLLNHSFIPAPVSFVAAILFLDLSRYASHWVLHKVAYLWRFHRVHHSDADIDVSTTIRTHPLEAVLIRLVQSAVILLLAPPVLAVFVYEVAAIVVDFFAHANADAPEAFAKWLGWLTFTPQLHRLHHSVDIGEQNRNLGAVFVWWDKIFGTYQDQSAHGRNFAVGLSEQQNVAGNVWAELLLPFRRL